MDYAAVARVRQLADPAHPDHNPAYRDWLAAGSPVVTAPPREPVLLRPAELARQRAAESCWHKASVGSCGCRGSRCELSRRLVTIKDCLACVDGAV